MSSPYLLKECLAVGVTERLSGSENTMVIYIECSTQSGSGKVMIILDHDKRRPLIDVYCRAQSIS